MEKILKVEVGYDDYNTKVIVHYRSGFIKKIQIYSGGERVREIPKTVQRFAEKATKITREHYDPAAFPHCNWTTYEMEA